MRNWGWQRGKVGWVGSGGCLVQTVPDRDRAGAGPGAWVASCTAAVTSGRRPGPAGRTTGHVGTTWPSPGPDAGPAGGEVARRVGSGPTAHPHSAGGRSLADYWGPAHCSPGQA